MTASEKLSKRETLALKRNLIVVSGYYGYDNLGDEAILEEIVAELAGFSQPGDIVVLSNNPHETGRLYGTRAENRWDLAKFFTMMKSTKLFISGGGGLFQDVRNLNSILFYGTQITLARLAGAKVMVYGQGVGPLNSLVSRYLTERFFRQATSITVRDAQSQKLLNSWGIDSQQTADLVWRLKKSPLPSAFQSDFQNVTAGTPNRSLLIGLSLRPSPNFQTVHMQTLAQVLKENLPAGAELLLLPFMAEADRPALEAFRQYCQQVDLNPQFLETGHLTQPSHWLSLMEKFDLVIAMRLHALIMALKAGKPVIGIPYDPKVSDVLQTFAQPSLSLDQPATLKTDWAQTLKSNLKKMPELAAAAKSTAAEMENKACQNFDILAKILQS
jgi:polysaccharide pyruvyl transferase CsaB